MTDHADMIRPTETSTFAEWCEAYDALLAERQQAQEERDDQEQRTEKWHGRCLELEAERDTLREQRRRAIDALRRIRDETKHYEPVDAVCPACLAEAALEKLGEDKP